MFRSHKKTFIKLNKVCFGYKPKQTILQDISFSILENEHICIIGSIGCGKSTLAKILAGLIKPQSGSIIFKGQTISKQNIHYLKDKVGIIFEDPNSQFIGLTVQDDIAFGLENQQIPQHRMQSIIDKVARYVGITDLLKQSTNSLSGGQKQLVAIASMLAMDPQLIIFDEVTSMLDNQAKTRINNLIQSLKKQHKTIITITHDMDEAAKADKILVMNKGKIAMVGTPKQIFNSSQLHNLSLDKPFALKLQDALKNNKKVKPNYVKQKTTSPIIACEHLNINLGSKKHQEVLINDFNYTFNKNKIYALVGKSGVGKTTLVTHFNGLNKSRYGNIYLNDISILGAYKKIKNYKALRKTVGLVFQFPEYQIFKDTVEKDLSFGPTNFGFSKTKIKDLVSKYIDLVGLDSPLLYANPFDLSNGQKRLVAIVGVLAANPDVIIFDEPTAGLDPAGVKKINQIITSLKRLGKTIIIITHNMDNVLNIADEVLVLHNHKLLKSGTPYEIFTNHRLMKEVNLATPYVIQELNKHKNLIKYQPRNIDELVYVLKKGGK